ncbi:MAG: hypothetical protein QG597_4121, partial [Actinomycetota bacterium]|nr:hypothetical protein [Actinomycetota bacterium]
SIFWLVSHTLAVWAVAAAPRAFAYPVVNAINWTGITDSHNVPLGAYYLSTISTAEAITEAGPGVSLVDPSSWVGWLASAVTTGASHDTIATMLQIEASIYILMITLALWLLRFVMHSVWLQWLATWFRPLFDTLQHLAADLYLFPLCLVIALAVGAFHVVVNNHRGHGWRVILSTIVIAVLGFVVTRDPMSELASDNGMLTQARNLGFTVSSAALNNGGIAAGNSSAQMTTLIQHIADAMVRMPLQLFNFGTVVDNIGSCDSAWSTAIMTGDPSGPAHAMTGCGAPQALSYAQHLDGASFGLGLFYLIFGAIFAFFVFYVAYSYLMVACAAFINAIMLIFAAPLAMIEGAPRQRALHRLTQFGRHVVLVFAYVTYISFVAVIVLKMAAPGGYAAQVGMTSPLALLFMVGLLAVAATGTFMWLKKQLGDNTRQTFTHAVRTSVEHGKSGWTKGQQAKDKIGKAVNKAAGSRTPGQDDDGTPAGSGPGGTPLTGLPSPGRGGPGGLRGGNAERGRRTTNDQSDAGRSPQTAPQTSPVHPGTPNPGTAPAASTGKRAAGNSAAEAATTAAAPEAAAAVAVASTLTQAHAHPRQPAPQSGRNGAAPTTPTTHRPRTDTPDGAPNQFPLKTPPGQDSDPAATSPPATTAAIPRDANRGPAAGRSPYTRHDGPPPGSVPA